MSLDFVEEKKISKEFKPGLINFYFQKMCFCF